MVGSRSKRRRDDTLFQSWRADQVTEITWAGPSGSLSSLLSIRGRCRSLRSRMSFGEFRRGMADERRWLAVQTPWASNQPLAPMCASVTSTDRPCNHLKRCRKPASVARLMAGIGSCRTGRLDRATAAIKAAPMAS